MKELFTVITKYKSGGICINQYNARDLEDLKEQIIFSLLSEECVNISAEEQVHIQVGWINYSHEFKMLSIEETVNCWYFFINVNIDINVVKTSRMIT